MNVTLDAPDGTATVAGTEAAERLLLLRLMDTPLGAAPLSLRVHCEVDPPTTVAGFREMAVRVSGLIVSEALKVAEARVAVTVTVVITATEEVVILKVAEVAPAATLTVAGTLAELRLLDRLILNPPAGAGPLMVTVPVEPTPPITDVGLTDTAVSTGALMLSGVERDVPFKDALMFATEFAATPTVVMVNVPEVAPPAMKMLAGTVAAAWSLAKATVTPPTGAEPDRVNVPVDELPPTTVVGLTEMPLTMRVTSLRFACVEEVGRVAVTRTTVEIRVGLVVHEKLAELDPAGTVTEPGPPQRNVLAEKATERPPVGAGPSMVIVPTVIAPPATMFGLKVRLVIFGIKTWRSADAELEFAIAVIVAEVSAGTGIDVTLKVAEEVPLGTVTKVGNPTGEADDLRLTTTPLTPALVDKETVAVVPEPPVTEVDAKERPVSV